MSRDFMCLMCPNGCHLTTTLKADGAVEVLGNRCDKGLGFARTVLKMKGRNPQVGLLRAKRVLRMRWRRSRRLWRFGGYR
jgi:CxxC motif-containing protein